MKELIEKIDLKLLSSKDGVEIYSTPINGLLVSTHNFYLDQDINENSVFIFFARKGFRFYTKWPLELAMSHSKESFLKWFSFMVKKRYKQALRTKKFV